ncbi:MAG TPA: hypothetical protein VMZ92_02345 [Planctomycetota bacterium]|nr:hypothetical protein [Planctomycetota bacterium]
MAKRPVIIVGFVLSAVVFFAVGFVAGRYGARETWKGMGRDVELLGRAIGDEEGATETGLDAQGGDDTEGALIGAGRGTVRGYIIGNEADKARMRTDVEASPETGDTKVVNVRNTNGSITPVTLRRGHGVWIGPRGEQYLTLPTPEQLHPIYGF